MTESMKIIGYVLIIAGAFLLISGTVFYIYAYSWHDSQLGQLYVFPYRETYGVPLLIFGVTASVMGIFITAKMHRRGKGVGKGETL